jgi:hypothetical protein
VVAQHEGLRLTGIATAIVVSILAVLCLGSLTLLGRDSRLDLRLGRRSAPAGADRQSDQGP